MAAMFCVPRLIRAVEVVKQRGSAVLRLDREAPFCEGLSGYFIQLMAGVRIWV